MIRKGLVMCILTFLVSTLICECLYYGVLLIKEFSIAEKVETLTVYEVSENNYDRDMTQLIFRYTDSETGIEYSSPIIYTWNKSIKEGDRVEVVTRNSCPEKLLSDTMRKRQRNTAERILDIGYDCGMIVHIIVTVILIIIFTLPNIRMIPGEIRRRKLFFTINTVIYTLIIISACVCFAISESMTNSWDGFGYAVLSIFLYAVGAAELLISWLINSIVLKIKMKK